MSQAVAEELPSLQGLIKLPENNRRVFSLVFKVEKDMIFKMATNLAASQAKQNNFNNLFRTWKETILHVIRISVEIGFC